MLIIKIGSVNKYIPTIKTYLLNSDRNRSKQILRIQNQIQNIKVERPDHRRNNIEITKIMHYKRALKCLV